MQASASASRTQLKSSDTQLQNTHAFLTSKFVVGSNKSDRINFSLAQKVFHSGDVPKEVIEAKRTVLKKKQPNILGTEKDDWNSSTIADPRIQKDVKKDLKRQLLKVRAGLMDEYVTQPSKMHSDEAIADRHKYIVATTGKGPIGMLTGKWFNPVDERGLASHCVDSNWQDWSQSTSTHAPEDRKLKEAVFQQKEDQRKRMMKKDPKLDVEDQKMKEAMFQEKEEKRKRMMKNDPKLDAEAYINPETSIKNVNERLRERKIDFQDLKDQFKKELKVEFPNASEERLQAMSQRLLNEKLLADEKMARFPVQHESFRPNLSLTTQDRRYKMYHHPGTYCMSNIEGQKRYCWSCCMSYDKDSKGCEYKIVNPDSWCTLGFERYHTSKSM